MGRSLAAHQRSDLLMLVARMRVHLRLNFARLVAIMRVHLNQDLLGW